MYFPNEVQNTLKAIHTVTSGYHSDAQGTLGSHLLFNKTNCSISSGLIYLTSWSAKPFSLSRVCGALWSLLMNENGWGIWVVHPKGNKWEREKRREITSTPCLNLLGGVRLLWRADPHWSGAQMWKHESHRYILTDNGIIMSTLMLV
jgi:hypothetical protein